MLIVVGSIQHESNTFCPGLCVFEDFDVAYGQDALRKIAPTAYLLDRNADICPTIYANSVPSGTVERATFDRLVGELLSRFPRGRKIDGVWLYCHGAMEVEGTGSGESAIVEAVRRTVGPGVPVAVALDFHANNTEDIARHANIICGYRTAPHTDIADTQLRAAKLLVESIEREELPVTALVRVPVIAAGDSVITDTEPMRSIIGACLKTENEEGILSATVFNGQNWVDAENNSASAAVVAIDQKHFDRAHAAAMKLGYMLWEARDDYRFQVDAMEPDDAIRAAMKEARLPVFVSDSGDNTTAGAPGSSACLLRSMLDNRVSSALLAGITCPSAVEACKGLAPGSSVSVDFGSEWDGPGGRMSVVTVLHGAGRLLGWDGDDAGECVVLTAPGVDIIATARPCAVISPEIIESSGVRLSDYGIVAVKLGYLFPRLAPAAGKAILALTPGVSCEDIAKINFTRVRRPMWPLDKDFFWPQLRTKVKHQRQMNLYIEPNQTGGKSMAYFDTAENGKRAETVREILRKRDLDFAIVYYDEFNVANGWYLTAWCPQFESGAVMVPREGAPMILGGPESEPFAKQDSAIPETRNLPVFMVPDEEYPNARIISFAELFAEISTGKRIRRVGIVGADQMPVSVHRQITENFAGVELVDITEEFLRLRYYKSRWELDRIKEAFGMAWRSYQAMSAKVAPGLREYEVAAEGEYVARLAGASSFAFKTIVGSGKRSNAVVPTAMDKEMQAGEMVMLGIAPRSKGYSGCFGHTLPVSGEYTSLQKEYLRHMKEVLLMTRDALKPGVTGKEIDAFGRTYFQKHDLMKYLVCPFAHTIGLMEAEAPFFGPNSTDVIRPGMAVCVDVSFFGHPELNGVRIETGYEITGKGPVPFSPEMEKVLLAL